MAFFGKKTTNSTLDSKLLGYRAQTSLVGRPKAILYGTNKIAPNVISVAGWLAKQVNSGKNYKGKNDQPQYDYIAWVLFGLCQGPIDGVYSIWQDKDKFNLAYSTEFFTPTVGTLTYTAAFGGKGNPFWWVINVGVWREDTITFTANDFGNDATPTSQTVTVETPMQLVEANPQAGQYTLNVDSNGFAHYTFSSADAGKKMGIRYSYQINNFSTSGDPLTHLNMVLFNGARGQQPWNAWQNNFPNQTLGYSELAYVASGALDLRSSGVVPSLNFEVRGRCVWGGSIIDANPAVIIQDMLSNPLDGVLGWATTASAETLYGPSQISGTCNTATTTDPDSGKPNGCAITATAGSFAGLAPGSSITIGTPDGTASQSYTVDGYTDTTHLHIADDAGTNTGLSWTATIITAFPSVTGASKWLPPTLAPFGLGAISGTCTTAGTAVTAVTGSFTGLQPNWYISIGGASYTIVSISADGTGLTTLEDTGTNASAVSWTAGGEVFTYCAANGLFISPILGDSGQEEARQIIQDLLEIANADCFWSEGYLKFRSYGDTSAAGHGYLYTPNTEPVYDIDDDDLICDPGQAPVRIKRPDPRDVKNQVPVEFVNRPADYSSNVLPPAEDAASINQYGRRPDSSRSHRGITEPAVAESVANTILRRLVYIENANQYEITIGPHFARLEPMDLITLTEPYLGFDKKPLRIIAIEEDDRCRLTLTLEEFPWSVSRPTLYPKQHPAPSGGYFANPDATNQPFFIQLPPEVAGGNPYVIGVALSGSQNWGGAAVYVSTDDGVSYKLLGKQTGPSTTGNLTAALPATNADPDVTDQLDVDLVVSYGEMASFSQAEADALVPLVAVDDELLAYETATLAGTYLYDLSYLRRGVYDSDVAAHKVGAQFAVVDERLFNYIYDPSVIDTTIWFKFASFNKAGLRQQSLSQVAAWPYFVKGPRVPYIWSPAYQIPYPADAMPTQHDVFGIQPHYEIEEDGTPINAVVVEGSLPPNVVSPLISAPVIAAVADTGGNLKAGTYFVVAAAYDGSGPTATTGTSATSNIVRVVIPSDGGKIDVYCEFDPAALSADIYVASPDTAHGFTYNTHITAALKTGTGSVSPDYKTLTATNPGDFLNFQPGWTITIGGRIYNIKEVAADGNWLNTVELLATYGKATTSGSTATITGGTFSGLQAGWPITIAGLVYTINSVAPDGSSLTTTSALPTNTTAVDWRLDTPTWSLTNGTISVTDFGYVAQGAPDRRFDHATIEYRRVFHSGILAAQVQAVTTTSVTITAPAGSGSSYPASLSGRILSMLAKYNAPDTDIPYANFLISGSSGSGDSTTVTVGAVGGVSPPDLTTVFGRGDLVTIRSTAVSATSNSYTDPLWINPFGSSGLDSTEEKGRYAWVMDGKDKGDIQKISSITGGTTINIAGKWKIQPDSTSVIIIVDSATLVELDPVKVLNKVSLPSIVIGSAELPNLRSGQEPVWAVRVLLSDKFGEFLDNAYVRLREMYFFPAQGTRTIAADDTLRKTDLLIAADATTGDLVVTIPPLSTLPNRLYIITKKDATTHSVTAQMTVGSGDTFADGSTSQTVSTKGASILIKVHGPG